MSVPRVFALVLAGGLVANAGCALDRDHAAAAGLWPRVDPVPPRATGPSHVDEFARRPVPVLPVLERPRCRIDVGCPTVPPIARCTRPRLAFSADEVVRRREELVDHVVTVRGPLELLGPRQTLVKCFKGCCNTADADVGLYRAQGAPRGVALAYWNHLDPARFTCLGDESTVCCGVALDGRVVLTTGVLRSVVLTNTMSADPGGHPTAWFLDDAEVCTED